ncbi:hypothetical protein GP486_008177 [Trichoglossum hirsutum]|uniref:Uncharacterized protein n=1 Tax=Trichoglossum hirsutum TaxID=265104 RepID=A0A9P8IHD4_9PEZI|nr:hypothetical protein GP486_008177 [Trichoglossum hirsutum]
MGCCYARVFAFSSRSRNARPYGDSCRVTVPHTSTPLASFTALPQEPTDASAPPPITGEPTGNFDNPAAEPIPLAMPTPPMLFTSPSTKGEEPAATASVLPAEPIAQPSTFTSPRSSTSLPIEKTESTISSSTSSAAPPTLPTTPTLPAPSPSSLQEPAGAGISSPITKELTANAEISPAEPLIPVPTPTLPMHFTSVRDKEEREGEGTAATAAILPADTTTQQPTFVPSGSLTTLLTEKEESTNDTPAPSVASPILPPTSPLPTPSTAPLKEPTDADISPPITGEPTIIGISPKEPLLPLTAPTPPELFTSSLIEAEETATTAATLPVEPIIQPSAFTSPRPSTPPAEEESTTSNSNPPVASLTLPPTPTLPAPSAASPKEPADTSVSSPITEEPTGNIDIPPAELFIPLTEPTPLEPFTSPPAVVGLASSSPVESPPTDEKPTSAPPLAEPIIPRKAIVKTAEEHERKKGKVRSRLRRWLGFFCLFKREVDD